jgi:hypothetical protein
MGLTQRGRSRTWIDDHGWWLGLVEFQPSSWSRGSYLNVGAMWLWDDKHASFHFRVGYRVDDAPFVEFESEAQFAPEARSMAEVAAREVSRYRELFTDLRSTAVYLDAREDGGNPHEDALDAGIAWGLLGDMKKAARSFDRAHLIIERYWQNWVSEIAIRSNAERDRARKEEGIFYAHPKEGSPLRAGLNEDHLQVGRFQLLLSEPDAFRAEVTAAIASVRETLRLPPAEPDFATRAQPRRLYAVDS